MFFITPHYDDAPYVLVRLERGWPDVLAELIEDAWRIRAAARVLREAD